MDLILASLVWYIPGWLRCHTPLAGVRECVVPASITCETKIGRTWAEVQMVGEQVAAVGDSE